MPVFVETLVFFGGWVASAMYVHISELGLCFLKRKIAVAEMSGNVEIPKRLLQRLVCDNEKSKQALRETQIREKTSSISGAGPKRAVAHHTVSYTHLTLPTNREV